MNRKIALTLAAKIIGNMRLVRTKKELRVYQGDLNYLANCIQNAADGKIEESIFQRE